MSRWSLVQLSWCIGRAWLFHSSGGFTCWAGAGRLEMHIGGCMPWPEKLGRCNVCGQALRFELCRLRGRLVWTARRELRRMHFERWSSGTVLALVFLFSWCVYFHVADLKGSARRAQKSKTDKNNKQLN